MRELREQRKDLFQRIRNVFLHRDVRGNGFASSAQGTDGLRGFPQARRAVLKKVLTKSQAFAEKARTLVETRLAAGELDAAIDALLEPELKKLEAPLTTGIGSAGNLPASSESTPDPERSPN